MPILTERDKPALRTRFNALRCPVRITVFVRDHGCAASRLVYDLLMELKGFSPMIDVEKFSIESEVERFSTSGVQHTPTTIIESQHGPNIRFTGVPKEYELAALLEVIEMIGTCSTGLRPEVRKQLDLITTPVQVKVFVTPASPYCPSAVITAMRLAAANPHVSAEMVDISLFPFLGEKYGVHGVPRVVINEEPAFDGSLPDDLYVEELLRIAEAPAEP